MLAHPALSVENLDFNTRLGPSASLYADAFLRKEYRDDLSDYQAATADLNADGIDEIILKKRGCEDSEILCRYLILAEKDNKMLLLSKIRARHIMLGEDYSHGVRDILAFKNRIDDYDYQIYVWDSSTIQYTIEKRVEENDGKEKK